MLLRLEGPADHARIAELTTEAFIGHPHSAGTEAAIIAALRRAGALALSLVAEEDGRVVGHAAFSPVIVLAAPVAHGAGGHEGTKKRNSRWYGLGPVAVDPPMQGRGLGSALIREGLSLLRRAGAHGCVLVGDPAYYGRFGFACLPGLTCDGIPPEYLLALSFSPVQPRGKVVFHPAFETKNGT